MELQQRDPGDILAIPVARYGWAYVRDLTRLYRAWTGERLGQLDELTLARLTSAVQAALDRRAATAHDEVRPRDRVGDLMTWPLLTGSLSTFSVVRSKTGDHDQRG